MSQKATAAIPDRHRCTIVQNIIVWQYLSYANAIGVPQDCRYCLIQQLGTREDQDNNDVVVGAGHAARMGT